MSVPKTDTYLRKWNYFHISRKTAEKAVPNYLMKVDKRPMAALIELREAVSSAV